MASSELNVELLKYFLVMQLPKVDSLKIGEKVAEKSPFWKTSFAIDLEKWLKGTFSLLWKQLLMRSGIWSRLGMWSKSLNAPI